MKGSFCSLFVFVFKRRTGFLVVILHFLVVILHFVGKGATRPLWGKLDKITAEQINPSPYSLLAQRIGEERHSLKRRERLAPRSNTLPKLPAAVSQNSRGGASPYFVQKDSVYVRIGLCLLSCGESYICLCNCKRSLTATLVVIT